MECRGLYLSLRGTR